MNLKLIEFIKQNPDNWKELLAAKPYCIDIKEDEKYVLFKYSMIDSDFSIPLVLEARGIIFDKENWICKRLAFFKFFNATEIYADKIDWNNCKIEDKVDGSLISIWNSFDGWHVSSSGTINAFEAISPIGRSYGEMFKEAFELHYGSLDEFQNKLNKDYCYSFELVHPLASIVILYKEPDIYHIATRDMTNLQELDIDIGIKKPEEYKFNSIEDTIEAAKVLKDDKEGYVCVDSQYHRVKIKSPKYVMIQHMKSTLSFGGILEVILKGEEQEVLAYVPQYQEYFDKIKETWNNYVDKMKKDYYNKIQPILNIDNQKEYALKAQSLDLTDIGFAYMCRKKGWIDKDNVEYYLRDIVLRTNLKERLKIKENKITKSDEEA